MAQKLKIKNALNVVKFSQGLDKIWNVIRSFPKENGTKHPKKTFKTPAYFAFP